MKLFLTIFFTMIAFLTKAQLYIGSDANLFLDNNTVLSTHFTSLQMNSSIQGSGNGKIVLAGNVAQSISSNSFSIFGLEINNNNHVVINDNLNITGNLYLENGKLILNNRSLTLSGVSSFNNGLIASGNLSNIYIEGNNGGSAGTLVFSNINDENKVANLFVNRTGVASSVTLGNTLKVLNNVSIANGTLNTGSGLLTLISTASNTARLTAGSGNYINGSITQERFVPAKSTRRWSFISSPVSQSLSNTWQQQIHITGSGSGGTACPTLTPHTNGFDATLSNAANFFTYNASLSSGNRWVANTTGTNNFNLTPGDGYRVLVRGNRSIGCSLLDGTNNIPTAVTLSATGVMSQGVNMGTVTKTYFNNSVNNWVLVGNPYPCELDFAAFATSNTGKIAASYIIYDPQNAANSAVPSNMYSTWNAGTWSNAPTSISNANGQFIANGQAFFVQSLAASNLSLTFQETHKYNGTQNGVFRTQNWNNIIRLHLQKDTVNVDNTVIRFGNESIIKNDVLTKYDATLLSSGNAYLATQKAGINMSIQTRTLNNLEEDEVPVNMQVNSNGQYELLFSEFENSTIDEIYLKDKYTSILHNIKQKNSYGFQINKTDSATYINRFSVIFKNKPAVVLPSISKVKLYPNPVQDQLFVELTDTNKKYIVRVLDIKGVVVQQETLNSGKQKMNVRALASGSYVVEIIDELGRKTVEQLIKL